MLDTNIIISGIAFAGNERKLLEKGGADVLLEKSCRQ